jgi:hypothetical protein
MTRKGGATISSGNDAVIEPINNNDLLGLGFESEELEMIEHMSQNEIINKYIETADQEYNINLPDINVVMQAAELSDIIPGTQVTKRNIAAQTMHNILNQNAGRSRRRRSRKSRKSRSRKSRRTYKRRR